VLSALLHARRPLPRIRASLVVLRLLLSDRLRLQNELVAGKQTFTCTLLSDRLPAHNISHGLGLADGTDLVPVTQEAEAIILYRKIQADNKTDDRRISQLTSNLNCC